MKTIFLEAANSYQGPLTADAWDKVIAAYKAGIGFEKAYTVLLTHKEKVKWVNYLGGYKFNGDKEDFKNGCLTNGNTPAKDLVACLDGITEDAAKHLFIISANNAHNWTYALSRRAFTHTKNDKKKVVLNFDNHRDYGVFTAHDKQGAITCGAWGGFHLGWWSHHSKGGAVYVTLANGKDGKGGGKWNAVYTADHEAKGHTETNPSDDEVIKLLEGYTSQNAEIYVTLDRDFMKGNGTKYGDEGCLHSTGDGIAFAAKFIKALKKGTIIGQDITGLPTNGQDAGVKAAPATYKAAVENVNDYVKLFA